MLLRLRYKLRFVVACLALALTSTGALAQLIDLDPDLHWREGQVPEPPPLTAKRLVRIDMPVFSSITVGVDVDTVQVNKHDGVVRYVTILQGRNGKLSAYYQGVHCNSFTGRTYARYVFDGPDTGWHKIEEEWQDLKQNKSFYARAIASSGACENSVPASNTARARRDYLRNNSKWKLQHPQIDAARTRTKAPVAK